MTFKNEYVLVNEPEASEFFKSAREILRTDYSKHDTWTVDRDNEMVLFRTGSGNGMESAGEDYWAFIDQKGRYLCDTTLISKLEISADEISIIRSISFRSGKNWSNPDAINVACIKDALREYKDWGVISEYKSCRLTLINAFTGKQI